MHSELNVEAAFRLTGLHVAQGTQPPLPAGLRPALAARYRDLTRLRYDFPIVLVADVADESCVQSLSAILDAVATAAAPEGPDRERIGKRLARLEREIRTLAARRAAATLGQLWAMAAKRLATDAQAQADLESARKALKVDGEVVDCDAAMPARFVTHAWSAVQARKLERLREELLRLTTGLADILGADVARSRPGHQSRALRQAVGTADRDLFDFKAMSRLLDRALPGRPLPEGRRQRVTALLAALEAHAGLDEPRSCIFDNCAAALHAFRLRAPKLSELAADITMARLEIAGAYVESQHDALFGQLRRTPLGPEDLARFPDFLVCVNLGELGANGVAEVFELIAAGAPVRVLVQSDDLLEDASVATEPPAIGARARTLAGMAIGLGEAFVLQSAASNLLQLRARVLAALTHAGPALLSVYSGAGASSSSMAPYLVAAAAMESRAFPAFTFEPGAERAYSLENNPQPELDWPLHALQYEDGAHQRVEVEAAFTAADFLAADARYSSDLAALPAAKDVLRRVPAADWIDAPPADDYHAVPTLRLVDEDDALHEVIAADTLLRQARRALDGWRLLQRLAKKPEPIVIQAAPAPAAEAAPVAPAQPAAAPAAAPAASTAPATAEAAPAAPASDDPYIETPRCTTCEECMHVNKRMFAYDANKQAYIADAGAGTYRELVEAAESCQVSIIHPGKPRNPDEPGLAELLERAAPFL